MWSALVHVGCFGACGVLWCMCSAFNLHVLVPSPLLCGITPCVGALCRIREAVTRVVWYTCGGYGV